MTDFNLWKNDINNRFSVTSLTDTTTGSIITATSVISGVTTTSGVHTSLWDAYKDLREKLLDGDTNILPKSTTTQRDALTGIEDGTKILNITTKRSEIISSSIWMSVAGAGMMSASAYGNMYENNSVGSAMESTAKTWITATAGVVDSNSLVTVVNDDVNGDYFLIGTNGEGDYAIIIDTTQTNAGNNDTVLTVQLDGVDTVVTKDERDSSSTKPTALNATAILALVATNKLRIHMVSEIPTDVVKAFHTHFYIHRLS